MGNEILGILTFIALGMGVIITYRLGILYLFGYSSFIIIASNATVAISVPFLGYSISLGIIIYSVVYLITDSASEFGEKGIAYKLAFSNLFVQSAFWFYMLLSLQFSPDSSSQSLFNNMQQLYETTPRITLAAFVASLGAFADIWLYEKIRNYSIGKSGFFSILAIRNNVSTFFGQGINTAIFFTIALYGVVDNIISIIIAAVLVKWAIALLDTPFLYVLRAVVPSQSK